MLATRIVIVCDKKSWQHSFRSKALKPNFSNSLQSVFMICLKPAEGQHVKQQTKTLKDDDEGGDDKTR